ncbi:MAG TPA: flagellar protein FlbB [Treponema sp.]|nr:flagellar protein FlbB [Treponema sp.]HBD68082.1 flagellar protein FlbB [Treponema sp.]
MAKSRILGKSILLIILIIILVLFGLLWFDFLGVIPAKKLFAPFFKLVGLTPQTSTTVTSIEGEGEADLDDDRYAKRLEALEIRSQELDQLETDLRSSESSNAQIAQELEDRAAELDEREKTFNAEVEKYRSYWSNIEQIVQNLEGMQPAKAVAILAEMDDQMIVDVFRRAEEDAAAAGTSSLVAYWLSLMEPTRAAVINRKLVNKPQSIDD